MFGLVYGETFDTCLSVLLRVRKVRSTPDVKGGARHIEIGAPSLFETIRRNVILSGLSYPFSLGAFQHDAIASEFCALEPDRLVVVADANAWAFHGGTLCRVLKDIAPTISVVVPGGEAAKTFPVLELICESALASGISRRSLIVAFGGGATGNVAGLAASMLFRGLRFVHMPTTLLAALDSVISLKQAINSRVGKNLLGAYHAPVAVISDVAFFETLPERELRSGMGEIVKNGLVLAPDLLPRLRNAVRPEMWRNAANMTWLVTVSVDRKIAVMGNDAYERNTALRLEYGHTVGHAIEFADLGRGTEGISHGEAIAIGMLVAAHVSERAGFAGRRLVEEHEELMTAAGLPTRPPDCVDAHEVMRRVSDDGKRGYLRLAASELAMVLLSEPGRVVGSPALPLTAVRRDLVDAVLADQVAEPQSWAYTRSAAAE